MRLLHGGALWRDEAAAINLATVPSFAELWSGLSYEVMPLGPLLLFRLWSAAPWGATDIGLRALGAVIGVGVLAAVWWQSRCMTRRPPLLSLALLGLSASVVHWGDSLRGYGLGLVLIIVTLALAWRMVESPSAGRIALAAAAAVASAQCVYQNAPHVAAIFTGAAAVALVNGRPRRAVLSLAAGLPAALSLVPYAIGPLREAQEWTMLVKSPTTVAGISRLVAEEFEPADVVVWLGMLAATCVLAAYLLRTSCAALPRERRDLVLFAAATVVASVVGLFVFTWRTEYRQVWHFLPVLAIVAVASDTVLGGAADGSRTRRWRLGLAAALVVLLLPPAWSARTMRYTDVDAIAGALGAAATRADLVVVDPWYDAISFQRYYAGSAPWTSLPAMNGVGIHRYDLMKATMMSEEQCQPLLDRINRTLLSGNDVWLVGRLMHPPDGKRPRSFRPAPHEGFWLETGYAQSWALQVGYLVDHHAMHVTEREPGDRLNPESLSVSRIRGWRESPHD